MNFFLSKRGFEALGGGIRIPATWAFKSGLGGGSTQKRFEKKGISFDQWEKKTFSGLDAMILIAHSNKESLLHTDGDKMTLRLDAKLQGLVNEFKRYIKAIEPGDVILNADNQPIEHFGYRDGISNPLFFKSDLDEKGTRHRQELRQVVSCRATETRIGARPQLQPQGPRLRQLSRVLVSWNKTS